MSTTNTIRALLLSVLAVLLLWGAATQARESGRFGLRATIGSSYVVVTLTLPAVCMRLTAHIVDELMAVSVRHACHACEARAARRSWS